MLDANLHLLVALLTSEIEPHDVGIYVLVDVLGDVHIDVSSNAYIGTSGHTYVDTCVST